MEIINRQDTFALRPSRSVSLRRRGDARGERAASPLGEEATPKANTQRLRQEKDAKKEREKSSNHLGLLY
jgi:hypothetical protein